MILDIRHLPETNELEVTDYNGFPTYINLSSIDPIEVNERPLGVETEYLINENIHVFFYPDGVISDWYEE